MQIPNAAFHAAHVKQAENTASPQLRQAADEFEASFLQELLKPLSEDSMFGSGADGAAAGSTGTISSIAAQALADGIAKEGGLGIAKRVLAELAPVERADSKRSDVSEGAKCGACSKHLSPLTESTFGPASVEMLTHGNVADSTRSLPVEDSVHGIGDSAWKNN